MRGTKVLTVLLVGAFTAGTVWAQMGDGDGSAPKRPPHKGFEGRGGAGPGQDKEGRGPGKGGRPEGQEPPIEMIIGRIIRNPGVAKKLGLTEEQVSSLRENVEQQQEERTRLREQMRIAAEEQVKLLQAEPVDEAAVMAAVEKTGAIHTEIAKLRIKGMLLVKKTLSAEQVARIKEHIRNRKEQGWKRRERDEEEDGEEGHQRPPKGKGKGRGKGEGKGWGRDKGNNDDTQAL